MNDYADLTPDADFIAKYSALVSNPTPRMIKAALIGERFGAVARRQWISDEFRSSFASQAAYDAFVAECNAADAVNAEFYAIVNATSDTD